MRWRSISLRYIRHDDLPALLRWRNSEVFREFCTKRRTILTEEQFARELDQDFRRDRHVQVVVESQKSELLGTLYSYDYSPEDGYLFITTYIDEPRKHPTAGPIAFSLFCRELFERWLLFKIYVDVYEKNKSVVEQLLRGGAEQEGHFRGHRKVGDERGDALRFAIYREVLERCAQFSRRASVARIE
jgi:RimJ/RimL family protein N-acetyltransferase